MSRHTIIPAVHLFLVRDNQILLSRRFQTGYEDGNYSVPAGHAEFGETATQAMAREVHEEVGIHCLPKDLRCVHVMHRKKVMEERVDFFFVCKEWEGEVENKELEKCDDLRWFALQELPKNTIPYVKLAISNYQQSIFFSEYGWNGER